MRSNAKCYDELRGYIATVPLVDCHDHSGSLGPKPGDPIRAVVDWYMVSDLTSASSDAAVEVMLDEKRPLEERWPTLEAAWKRTKYTGYAQVVRRAIKQQNGDS